MMIFEGRERYSGETANERYEIAAQEDRCGQRAKLFIPGQLRASGGKAFRTLVSDLSISGFRASAINRMQPGQICWISLPSLESLQAKVIWWDKSLVGCAFAELLSPIVHDNLVSRYSGTGVCRSAC